ncbi:hypothetical protein [Psychromonas sp. SP041]|uniref:hypothetical protein n=1 Tax=Psychromonas sp. SP041 TaxID=1365007 RepID=UPI0010C7A038|nr:hypothetical protein [Psychromonas sp. SP041]
MFKSLSSNNCRLALIPLLTGLSTASLALDVHEESEHNGLLQIVPSKTVYVVHDKLNTCTKESIRFMYREQKIFLPNDTLDPTSLESLDIYYGKEKPILNEEINAEKLVASGLNKMEVLVLNNGYFKIKKDGVWSTIKSLHSSGPESKGRYLSLTATDMPGAGWPANIVLAFKNKGDSKTSFIYSEVKLGDKSKRKIEVMPFSFKIDDGLMITKGVPNIKGPYSVNYETTYENRSARSYIKLEDEINSKGISFKVSDPDQLSKLNVFYDLHPGDYSIDYESQFRITLFDLSDNFFLNCDINIPGFVRQAGI